MINDKEVKHISKFLSLVLRHQPQLIGIQLDQNGWTNVEELIKRSNDHGVKFDTAILQHVVDTNAKKRFAFNETLDKIRASQGHSIEIELGYSSQQPPEFLYHGTAEKFVPSILKTGLEKRNRQHVHLSSDISTATRVGQRHGTPFIFIVRAAEMYRDKFLFYLSANGVWLTNHVPSIYLTPMDTKNL